MPPCDPPPGVCSACWLFSCHIVILCHAYHQACLLHTPHAAIHHEVFSFDPHVLFVVDGLHFRML